MSGWTIEAVCEEAEQAFAYYLERDPGTAVREAVTCILSDLDKFDDGRVVLKKLDTCEMFRIMHESDDTAMHLLIKTLRASHAGD